MGNTSSFEPLSSDGTNEPKTSRFSRKKDHFKSTRDSIQFNQDEVAILLSSFKFIKSDRDKIAVLIHNSVANNSSDSIAKYHAMRSMQKDLSAAKLGLGVTIMAGVERILVQLGDQQGVSEFTKRLKMDHAELLNVQNESITMALGLTETIFEDYISNSVNIQAAFPSENIPNVKETWSKFFAYAKTFFET